MPSQEPGLLMFKVLFLPHQAASGTATFVMCLKLFFEGLEDDPGPPFHSLQRLRQVPFLSPCSRSLGILRSADWGEESGATSQLHLGQA